MTDTALIAAVTRLAAPADAQTAYILGLGTGPSLDELALGFDDQFARLRDPAADESSQAFHAALTTLDAQLDLMSGEANSPLWLVAALDRPEWQRVRELAQRALSARPG